MAEPPILNIRRVSGARQVQIAEDDADLVFIHPDRLQEFQNEVLRCYNALSACASAGTPYRAKTVYYGAVGLADMALKIGDKYILREDLAARWRVFAARFGREMAVKHDEPYMVPSKANAYEAIIKLMLKCKDRPNGGGISEIMLRVAH